MSPTIATRFPRRSAHRVEVEQRLRRVGVLPVAAVDHASGQVPRDEVGRACGLMAHHQYLGPYRFERAYGIDEGLALFDARSAGGDVDDVRSQRLAGQLERRARAGARFVEQRHDRPAAQRRHAWHFAAEDLFHGVGGVEDRLDLVA
jgi:hypothetical protein